MVGDLQGPLKFVVWKFQGQGKFSVESFHTNIEVVVILIFSTKPSSKKRYTCHLRSSMSLDAVCLNKNEEKIRSQGSDPRVCSALYMGLHV